MSKHNWTKTRKVTIKEAIRINGKNQTIRYKVRSWKTRKERARKS